MTVERLVMAWNPSEHAIHIETVEPDDASPGSVLIEHFNDPYEVALPDESDGAVFAAAHGYLEQLLARPIVCSMVQVPSHWLPALAPAEVSNSEEPYFGWLPFEPIGEGERSFGGAFGSFRFESASDKLVALFASERLSAGQFLGSGFGLAVAMHIRENNGSLTASFVGVTASLPFGPYRSHPLSAERVRASTVSLSPASLYRDTAVIRTMSAAANLDGFLVRSIRIALKDKEVWIERQGIGVRRVVVAGYDPHAPAGEQVREEYSLEIPYVVSMLSVDGPNVRADTILHVALAVADATGAARVFDNDPSSVHGLPVRPTRNEQADPPTQPFALDPFRVDEPIFSGVNTGPLEFPATGPAARLIKVMPCPRFVPADQGLLPPGQARPVTLNHPHDPTVRSDDASAVQAFFHARDLVQRIESYGWSNPASYFRITRPEIKIFYRSGISPGPGKDGRTVNARVIPEGWPSDAIGAPPGAGRPAVGIHLAAADLRRRERKTWTPGGSISRAIPFGVGGDKRWMWHEFGHTLLVASTGELEFRFAHSPGDAMAAIVADPESALPPKLRGMTFPFVYLPRQHNRCALDGWSWSGTMHADLQKVPAAKHPRRKGYWSEQILSSSLFRMYRCIGGDTCIGGAPAAPDRPERRRASHYALYLIMQAMQLMGDARIQATSTPARFVHWLRQADRQTGQWAAAFPFRRVGGTMSKVIRWAFEAQGLYGSGDGPGSPKPVDIYIEDGRPNVDVEYGLADYGPGSYVPVSLHWQPFAISAPAGALPRWQANATTGILFPNASGKAEVHVGNRGSASIAATNVSVKLWSAAWADGVAPPHWNAGPGVWTQCSLTGPATQNIPPGPPSGSQPFTFTFAPAPGRYILFAQATCNDDRANTDPALSLACSYELTPLVDLVANDNNLGLLVVTV